MRSIAPHIERASPPRAPRVLASLWALATVLLLACSRTEPRVLPPVPAGAIAIDETTVGTVEGRRVGVSNIWDRSIPPGTPPQPSAMLAIWCGEPCPDNRDLTVVVGTERTLDGKTYRVLAIDEPPHQLGRVVLTKVP